MSALIALGAIATAAALFADSGTPSSVSPTTTGATATTRRSEALDPPRVAVRGVSYRLGQSGDLAFYVPCEGTDRVVVIRPTTGDIFVFDRFAEAGAPLTAQSVGRVEGALEILAGQSDTCSELVVATDDALLQVSVPTRTR